MTAAVGRAGPDVGGGQRQRLGDLRAGDLTVPPPWKPCSIATTTDRVPADAAAADDGAVIGLRGDALGLQPRGLEPVEGPAQHSRAVPAVEERGRARPSASSSMKLRRREQLLPGLPARSSGSHGTSMLGHRSPSSAASAAWRRRRVTTPGVAPKSLSSQLPGHRRAGEEPVQHVVPHGVESVDAGADAHRRLGRPCRRVSRISRSPEPTTPTCTARAGGVLGGESVVQRLHASSSVLQSAGLSRNSAAASRSALPPGDSRRAAHSSVELGEGVVGPPAVRDAARGQHSRAPD